METTTDNRGDVTVVTVGGKVDASNADAFGAALTAPMAAGTAKVVLDCAGLEYISSAGLRQILGGLKAAQAGGGELVLASVVPDVERVLKISGFSKLMRLESDTDAAVATLA